MPPAGQRVRSQYIPAVDRATAIPDMLSISATLTNDGNIVVNGASGTGVMVAATVDIGAAGTVAFTPTVTPAGQPTRTLPVTLTICPTNASANCISPAAPSVTASVSPNQVLTFNVTCRDKEPSSL